MTEPKFLFDANCCIYLIEKLSPPLRARAQRCAPGEIVTSAVAFAEVARGTDWSNPEAASLVMDFFSAVQILPFDQAAGRAYAELPFARHRFDRLIRAHAMALGLTAVTANISDYRDVPGLAVEDWTR